MMMSEPNGYDPDVIMMTVANTLVAAAAVLETAVELARKTGLKGRGSIRCGILGGSVDGGRDSGNGYGGITRVVRYR